MTRTAIRCFSIALALALFPCSVRAWGSAGHIMINRMAAQQLPPNVPAFVRTASAVDEIAALGPEEDRLKGAGTSWDADDDRAHFVDVGDDGKIAGIVHLDALPPTIEAYAQALLARNTSPFRMGYLPYAIADGFERVRKDFAIWRVDDYLATHATTKEARGRFVADGRSREALTIRDIGVWGHFVADGCQPLHVTVHYNGWGNYPNPKGYSTDRTVHATFESTFVSAHINSDSIRPYIAPYAARSVPQLQTQEQISAIVGSYLSGSASAVPELYDLWGANGFAQATPPAREFTARQLARGVSTLRDLISLAWNDSINGSVGYPPVQVLEVLHGTVVPSDPAE